MTPLNTLLVATDFSVDGDNAVRRAARLAHELGAGLHILHVVRTAGCRPLRHWRAPAPDIGLLAAQARTALQRLAIEISRAHDVAATLDVRTGDPLQALRQAADRADLVVLGRRVGGPWDAWLGGRLVQGLLAQGRHPLLVVRAAADQPYRQLLVPIDFSPTSDAALRIAARLRQDARLQLLHALGTAPDALLRDADVPEHIIRERRALEEDATQARMRRKAAALGLDAQVLSVALAYGSAAAATVRQARRLGADLIVAGQAGRWRWADAWPGSLSRRVLSQATGDLLIVPRWHEATPTTVSARPGADAARPLPPSKAPAPVAAAGLVRPTATPAATAPHGHWMHRQAPFVSRRAS